MEVVASLSQGRTAAAQCDLFTHKSVPVIFEPPCTNNEDRSHRRPHSGGPAISKYVGRGKPLKNFGVIDVPVEIQT